MVQKYFQRLSILDHFHLWNKIHKMKEKEIKTKISVTWEAYWDLRKSEKPQDTQDIYLCLFLPCSLAVYFLYFSKFSEVCSSNKHQLLIELASPFVFYFNGDSLQGSAAYSLHCSAQCSCVTCCNTSPFTEAVTFISVKRIIRSESKVCSAFGGVECKLKGSQGCNVGNAEKARCSCICEEMKHWDLFWVLRKNSIAFQSTIYNTATSKEWKRQALKS